MKKTSFSTLALTVNMDLSRAIVIGYRNSENGEFNPLSCCPPSYYLSQKDLHGVLEYWQNNYPDKELSVGYATVAQVKTPTPAPVDLSLTTMARIRLAAVEVLCTILSLIPTRLALR